MPVVKDDPQAATALTISLASLASAASRQSLAYDNSSNLYVDVLIGASFTAAASGTLSATSPNVTVYVAPLMDGAHYTDGCTGFDATFTPPAQPNSAVGAVVGIGAAGGAAGGVTYYGLPFSVASLFGGKLPTKFAVWVTNNTGLALGTAGGAITATPSYYQAV